MMPVFVNPVKGLLDRVTASLLSLTLRVCSSTWFVLSRGCLLCTATMCLSLTALLFYSLLLSLLMPIVHQSSDVHLYTSGDCKQGEVDTVAGIVFQRETYLLNLILDLPETEANFNLGNFDVKVTFSGNQTAQGMVTFISGDTEISKSICQVHPRNAVYWAIRSGDMGTKSASLGAAADSLAVRVGNCEGSDLSEGTAGLYCHFAGHSGTSRVERVCGFSPSYFRLIQYFGDIFVGSGSGFVGDFQAK